MCVFKTSGNFKGTHSAPDDAGTACGKESQRFEGKNSFSLRVNSRNSYRRKKIEETEKDRGRRGAGMGERGRARR